MIMLYVVILYWIRLLITKTCRTWFSVKEVINHRINQMETKLHELKAKYFQLFLCETWLCFEVFGELFITTWWMASLLYRLDERHEISVSNIFCSIQQSYGMHINHISLKVVPMTGFWKRVWLLNTDNEVNPTLLRSTHAKRNTELCPRFWSEW